MKRILISVLVLAVADPLVAAGEKRVPTHLSSEEQAKRAEEPPPPNTLDEAHERLEKLLSKKELAEIDAMKCEDEMIRYHFGLGTGMRNAWGLWAGGSLARHMRKLGFGHYWVSRRKVKGAFRGAASGEGNRR